MNSPDAKGELSISTYPPSAASVKPAGSGPTKRTGEASGRPDPDAGKAAELFSLAGFVAGSIDDCGDAEGARLPSLPPAMSERLPKKGTRLRWVSAPAARLATRGTDCAGVVREWPVGGPPYRTKAAAGLTNASSMDTSTDKLLSGNASGGSAIEPLGLPDSSCGTTPAKLSSRGIRSYDTMGSLRDVTGSRGGNCAEATVNSAIRP